MCRRGPVKYIMELFSNPKRSWMNFSILGAYRGRPVTSTNAERSSFCEGQRLSAKSKTFSVDEFSGRTGHGQVIGTRRLFVQCCDVMNFVSAGPDNGIPEVAHTS